MAASLQDVGRSVSNAEKCKEYREKNKGNALYMETQRLRKQEQRINRTETQIERDRQTAKERMQKMREKRKNQPKTESGVANKTSRQPVTTRAKREEKREKWRQYKKTYREKLTSQKRRRIREKDSAAKAENNFQKKKVCGHIPKFKAKSCQPYNTQSAVRKAVARGKEKLPQNPQKYVTVLKGLIDSASPEKRKLISEDGIIMTPTKRAHFHLMEKNFEGLKVTLKKLKVDNTDQKKHQRKTMIHHMSKTLKKHKILSQTSKLLGIRYRTMLKWSRCPEEDLLKKKKRTDAFSEREIIDIKDFYVKPYVSVVHSAKVTVSKESNQRQSLNYTLKEAHSMFLEENPTKKVSFSKFASLKPSHVKTIDKQNFRGCLCEKCVNTELQLKSLNKELPQSKQIRDRYALSSLSMCTHDGEMHPKLACVRRQCNLCSIASGLKEHKLSLEDKMQNTVYWNKWQTVKVKNKKTGEEHAKKLLVSHTTPLKELVDDITTCMEDLSAHLFEARWQYQQFSSLKENLPEGVLLCVLDFAENYTTRTQDEVQSAHWAQNQITIHPVVCYYGKFTHEMVFVSDDIKHDANFVEVCVTETVKQLKTVHNVQFSKMIQFTDGCSSQYKSKIPFMDISSRIDVKTERHFFGSGHGKGPADACCGVVKAAVTRAVKGGGIISSAEHLVAFADTHLRRDKQTFRRTFYLVKSEEIKRDRETAKGLTTIKGTRKLHCVRGVSSGTIATRELSCLCHSCLDFEGESGICKSTAYADNWKIISFQPNLQKTDEKKSKRTEANEGNVTSKYPDAPETSSQEDQAFSNAENIISVPPASESKKENRKPAKKSEACPNAENNMPVPNATASTPVVDEAFFKDILEDLRESDSLKMLQIKAAKYQECIQDLLIDQQRSIVDDNLTVDKLALNIYPTDVESGNMSLFPTTVKGDGNCLPRSGSVIAFGNESHHKEIRARIVLELASHVEVYTDPTFLCKGTRLSTKEAEDLPKSYVMYSDVYTPGDVITPFVIERTLYEEIQKICKLKEYMGIWQLFGLSSVLKRPLISVYPNLGNTSVRKDLNRTILPRHGIYASPAYIMWSSNRTHEMVSCHWVPNHFCPLIPLNINKVDDVQLLEEVEGDLDFSADSEQLEALIQSLYEEEISDSFWLSSVDKKVTMDNIVPDNQAPASLVAAFDDQTHVVSAPVVSAPVVSAPVVSAPVVAAPVVSAPVVSAPVVSAPVVSAPVLSAPVLSAPVLSAPVLSAPVLSAPVVSTPAFISDYIDLDLQQEVSVVILPENLKSAPVVTATNDQRSVSTPSHNMDQLQERFKTGTYISVIHGTQLIPAVINEWPFVRYFKKERNGWVEGRILHTVIRQDVHDILEVPSLKMCGSRFYYTFSDDSLQLMK